MQIAIVLGLLFVALILFSWDRIRIDVVTIGLLAILMAAGILTPMEAFAGFGSDFIIMLAAIFVISGALQQTGVLDLVGSRMLKIAQLRPAALLTLVMFSVGFTSAFMNNTTVTAIYIAPVMAVARKLKMSPSRLLLPVAYASILGGCCTLIGTSTNIAVGGYLHRNGIGEIGMFDLLPVGASMFVVGWIYMNTIGKRLLPDRPEVSVTDEFGLREYVSEVVITPGSPLIGQTVFHSNLSRMGFRILNMVRGEERFIPDPTTRILEHDLLIVEGKINDLLEVREREGISIRADLLIDRELQSERFKLAEILVTPESEFLNSTLKEAKFRQRYGLTVLAINRTGYSVNEKLGRFVLRSGDVLLVQGSVETISYHKRSKRMQVMSDFMPLLYRKSKGLLTLGLFITAVIVGSLGWLPLSVTFLLASVVAVGSGAISVSKAYEAIDMRLLILIGGMTAFGFAMSKTGTDQWLADQLVRHLLPFGEMAIMAGFVILTVFLTQPLSNAAAALVVLPVAIETAHRLSVNPMTFGVAVMLSASVSLITPFEPSCILVYGPGRYRFSDFFRTGWLLTALLMAVLMLLVPILWPLH